MATEDDDFDAMMADDEPEMVGTPDTGKADAKGEKHETASAEPDQADMKEPETDDSAQSGEDDAPPASDGRQGHIPIATLLDEREKRQKAEQRAEEIERKLRDFETQKQSEANEKPAPDPIDDPQAYNQHIERIATMQRFATLEAVARDSHGDDKVEAAQNDFKAQADKNPSLWQEFYQARSPYGYLLKWHERQSVLSEIGEDPAAYRERIRQEVLAEAQAQAEQPAGQPASRPANPPPSLARGGQGGATPETMGEDEAFSAAFR